MKLIYDPRGLTEQQAIEIRRAERERCARIAEVMAKDAIWEYSSTGDAQIAADMARRIARELRLAED